MELVAKPLKLLPLGLLGYLFYAVYYCPCKDLLMCHKERYLMIVGAFTAMILLGYPLILTSE